MERRLIKNKVKKEVSRITPKMEKVSKRTSRSLEVLVQKIIKRSQDDLHLRRHSKGCATSIRSIRYGSRQILLDTYGDNSHNKRPRDGVDDDQEPSAGTDRRETTTTTAEKTTTGSKTHKQSASQSAPVEETMQTTDVFEAPAHQEFETGVHDITSRSRVQHLLNVSNNLNDYKSLSCMELKNRRQFYVFATTRESAHDVYSKRRIIAVTKVEIVKWQNYKHLDWITIRRDDDVLYKFKEGDFHRLRIQDIEDMNFHRLRIQDIEDMLLLLVQEVDKSQR
ncbi:hypothetical protein Tco_0584318 [Tanacetum coccineum]